jgi:hypothetical protein
MKTMQWFSIQVLCAALVILSAGACRPEPPSTPTPSRICTPEELVRIDDADPSNEIIDTLTPTLQWTYPDPDCHPERYEIRIFTRWYTEFDIEVVGWSSETSFTVPPSQPLQPATHYYYVVVAESGRTEGPAEFGQFEFDTGPQCDGAGELLPPILRDPPDGYHLTSSFLVVDWEDPSPCTPAGGYTIQFSTSPAFDAVVYTKRTSGITDMAFIGFTSDDEFPYEECAVYYWRVQVNLPGTDDDGPWSASRSMWTDIRRECLWPPIPGPSPHLEATATATPGTTPAASSPTATLLQHANCRRGPSVEYDIVTNLPQGLTAPITGRNPQSTWWQILVPGTPTQCWLAEENVKTSGDTSQVPVVEAEPLGCWVWTGNKNECVAPCPEGAQPGGACTP